MSKSIPARCHNAGTNASARSQQIRAQYWNGCQLSSFLGCRLRLRGPDLATWLDRIPQLLSYHFLHAPSCFPKIFIIVPCRPVLVTMSVLNYGSDPIVIIRRILMLMSWQNWQILQWSSRSLLSAANSTYQKQITTGFELHFPFNTVWFFDVWSTESHFLMCRVPSLLRF